MTSDAKPDLVIVVHGSPAPQGSKRHVGNGVMIEETRGRTNSWREAVVVAAMNARVDAQTDPEETVDSESVPGLLEPKPIDTLDGPLAAAMTFTMRHKPKSRPAWWPVGVRWSSKLWWRPASMPDLSKLTRSTEDALTDAGAWRDDARIVEYRLAKHFIGDQGQDVLASGPGAVIRIWRLAADATPPPEPDEQLALEATEGTR